MVDPIFPLQLPGTIYTAAEEIEKAGGTGKKNVAMRKKKDM